MVRCLIAFFLKLLGGGKGLFIPQGKYSQKKPKTVTVLTPGMIPTTDIYLLRRMSEQFKNRVHYVNTLQKSPHEISLTEDSMIVIVRHAPAHWLHWLKSQQSQITRVIFLMDDDIPGALLAPELPFHYAIKTAWRFAHTRRILRRICSDVYVSTQELLVRYSTSCPKLMEPEYVSEPLTEKSSILYFYHGSWAHHREMKWLVPIVRKVQDTVPNAWFEIMGTDKVRRLFRGIPRVRVIHPMPWKDYINHASLVRYQVGLAPCFDTPFNQARSHSKIFDITRLGAAGIYSSVTPYTNTIINGTTGVICVNHSDAWTAAVIMLLDNEDMRTSIYLKAKAWCLNNNNNLISSEE